MASKPKGQSTTGTVHYLVFRKRNGALHPAQACGMSTSQRVSLTRVSDDTPVTCQKCIAKERQQ